MKTEAMQQANFAASTLISSKLPSTVKKKDVREFLN
jgi:hypothetical protein